MAALVDTRMPGVYTVEVPTIPPSIALVPTAVPVFIGYTQIHERNGETQKHKTVRVRNMREYITWFGGPDLVETTINADVQDNNGVVTVSVSQPTIKHRMYYAMQLYYANGGGPCYILSIGAYNTPNNPYNLGGPGANIVKALKKNKDITIIVMPDAVKDGNYNDAISLALQHCSTAVNRVTIIDVDDIHKEDNDKITNIFRGSMPTQIDQKKYGAAYYPFLNTTLDYDYDDANVIISNYSNNGTSVNDAAQVVATQTALNDYKTELDNLTFERNKKRLYQQILLETAAIPVLIDAVKKAKEIVNPPLLDASVSGAASKVAFDSAINAVVTDILKEEKTRLRLNKIQAAVTKAYANNNSINIADLVTVASAEHTKYDPVNPIEVSISGAANYKKITEEINTLLAVLVIETASKSVNAKMAILVGLAKSGSLQGMPINVIEEINNGLASQIREAIRNLPVVMPPSPAIAGLYVATDLTQGVWKAPANASLAAVSSTTVEIDDDFHAALNVDASTGKSINAIRPYTGRGILVYGARTLAGNDLEWRYISVRRTFCFIEDAIGRAMLDFVFAPNTRDTWIKVKAMINNFLNEIWKAGGLFGDTTKEAYQVNVGQPETMTDVDILEGKMIVEIKLRVARPAEFIVLRYEHKFNATSN